MNFETWWENSVFDLDKDTPKDIARWAWNAAVNESIRLTDQISDLHEE